MAKRKKWEYNGHAVVESSFNEHARDIPSCSQAGSFVQTYCKLERWPPQQEMSTNYWQTFLVTNMPEFPQFHLVQVDFNWRYCTLTENVSIKTRNYTQWNQTRSATVILQKYDDNILVKACRLISIDRGLKGGKARQFALKRWKCVQNCSCIKLKKALLYNGSRVSIPGVKRSGRGETTHPHVVQRLNKESYTSTPLLGLHGLFYG
jgi:hypothetical protein